jgi:hypothetical protein
VVDGRTRLYGCDYQLGGCSRFKSPLELTDLVEQALRVYSYREERRNAKYGRSVRVVRCDEVERRSRGRVPCACRSSTVETTRTVAQGTAREDKRLLLPGPTTSTPLFSVSRILSPL